MTTKKHRSAKNHLAEWLEHPGADLAFGASFRLKLEILACIISRRGTLAAIARRHRITRQGASKHARQIRLAFGLPLNGDNRAVDSTASAE